MRLKPIIPSVLGLERQVVYDELPKLLDTGFVDTVHVDTYSQASGVSYFNTVENISELADLLFAYQAKLELHLLSAHPLQTAEEIVQLGLRVKTRMSIQIEDESNLAKFVFLCREAAVTPGLAIKLATPLPLDTQFLREFDYIHFICTDEKAGLTSFQNSVFDKVALLLDLCPEKQVLLDCGIKIENINMCVTEGAAQMVMGSAIFKNPDKKPREVVQECSQIIERL